MDFVNIFGDQKFISNDLSDAGQCYPCAVHLCVFYTPAAEAAENHSMLI